VREPLGAEQVVEVDAAVGNPRVLVFHANLQRDGFEPHGLCEVGVDQLGKFAEALLPLGTDGEVFGRSVHAGIVCVGEWLLQVGRVGGSVGVEEGLVPCFHGVFEAVLVEDARRDRVQRGEGFRVLEGQSQRDVAAHREAAHGAALGGRECAIVGVDVGNGFLEEKVAPVAGDGRVGAEGAVERVDVVDADKDELVLAQGGLDAAREVGDVAALVIAGEKVEDGVALRARFCVGGRQVNVHRLARGLAGFVARERERGDL